MNQPVIRPITPAQNRATLVLTVPELQAALTSAAVPGMNAYLVEVMVPDWLPIPSLAGAVLNWTSPTHVAGAITAIRQELDNMAEFLPDVGYTYEGGVLTIWHKTAPAGPAAFYCRATREFPGGSTSLVPLLFASLPAPYFESVIAPGDWTKLITRSARGPWNHPAEPLSISLPVVETLPTGWDQMRERLVVPFTPYFACGTERQDALDPRAAPFALLLAQEERVVGSFGPFPIVELLSLGFAREKPWQCVTSGDMGGTIGSSIYRNLPTVTCTWFSSELVGTMDAVPWPCVPPETFGWPAMAFSSVDTDASPALVIKRQGWLLIKRDVDPLPVMTGTPAGLWRSQRANGCTVSTNPFLGHEEMRSDANLPPRPRLCKVVDYYTYKPVNALPGEPGAASNP